MKILVIILSLVCAGLAFGLYQRNSGADKQEEAATTQFQSLSNQLAELRTRLALEQGTASHSQSNMQSVVDRRTGEMLNASNRLVQLNLLYRTAQAECRNTQAELQSYAASLAVADADLADLQRRLAIIAPLESKLTEAKQKLSETSVERNSLLQEVRRLEVDRADLSRKLDDIGFLRIQLTKAEENAAIHRRLAKAGQHASIDPKSRLEWQDDGTVHPVISAGGERAK